MDIQAQATATAKVPAGRTAGVNGGAASGEGFSKALSGMMTTEVQSDSVGSGAGLSLSGLVQLLSPMETAELSAILATLVAEGAAMQSDSGAEEQAGQLEEEQAGLEALLSELNALLFVPITAAADTSAVDTENGEAELSQVAVRNGAADALQVMKQMKELLAGTDKDAQLKQLLDKLPSLMTAAASASEAANTKTLQESLTASQDSNGTAVSELLVPKSTSPMQKLEAIAVNYQAIKLAPEQQVIEEAPLFEPLNGELGTSEPITLLTSEQSKQAANSQAATKAPVLHMPAQNFADDMTKFVVSSFVLGTNADGATEAKISLYPQHLGHVEVKLTMQNGQLIAQFVADSAAGKEMLEGQLASLRSTLQSQGIQVEKLEVTQNQSFQSSMFQDGRKQQSQQSFTGQNKNDSKLTLLEDADEEANQNSSRSNGNGAIDFMA
ncbi:flagellar hook-length control protein FliK [Paenibacillus sp. YYML68]|uniref:flagellar hook-length control protein FliK n=1 Tax=Paenibacillus sp. YYML68 TaxID=2909250 RepID=UPI0024939A92|nr:flagellar hook-length control protein FliK [Paenibacillus sp. YYML68]